MSRYLNPLKGTKEEWLMDHGLVLPHPTVSFPHLLTTLKDIEPDFFKTKCLVVLICNGVWNAAAVCTSEEEFLEWDDPSDPRPMTIFIVNKQKALAEVRDFIKAWDDKNYFDNKGEQTK